MGSLEGNFLTKHSWWWWIRLNRLQWILLQDIPELPLHFWIQDIEGLLWMYTTIQLIAFKKVIVWFSVPLENRNKKSDFLFLAHSFPNPSGNEDKSTCFCQGSKVLLYLHTHPLCPPQPHLPFGSLWWLDSVTWAGIKTKSPLFGREESLNEISHLV